MKTSIHSVHISLWYELCLGGEQFAVFDVCDLQSVGIVWWQCGSRWQSCSSGCKTYCQQSHFCSADVHSLSGGARVDTYRPLIGTLCLHSEVWFVRQRQFLSASLYFSKRGTYWHIPTHTDLLTQGCVVTSLVVGWLSRACTVAKRCILGL